MGASGGSIDIDPEPFQASRMAHLLCKTPIFERKDTATFVTPGQSIVEAGAVTSNLSII